MMRAFCVGNNDIPLNGEDNSKSFMLANIKSYSLIVKYKNVTFLYFPLRKVASTFTIEKVSNILYWKNKSK